MRELHPIDGRNANLFQVRVRLLGKNTDARKQFSKSVDEHAIAPSIRQRYWLVDTFIGLAFHLSGLFASEFNVSYLMGRYLRQVNTCADQVTQAHLAILHTT